MTKLIIIIGEQNEKVFEVITNHLKGKNLDDLVKIKGDGNKKTIKKIKSELDFQNQDNSDKLALVFAHSWTPNNIENGCHTIGGTEHGGAVKSNEFLAQLKMDTIFMSCFASKILEEENLVRGVNILAIGGTNHTTLTSQTLESILSIIDLIYYQPDISKEDLFNFIARNNPEPMRFIAKDSGEAIKLQKPGGIYKKRIEEILNKIDEKDLSLDDKQLIKDQLENRKNKRGQPKKYYHVRAIKEMTDNKYPALYEKLQAEEDQMATSAEINKFLQKREIFKNQEVTDVKEIQPDKKINEPDLEIDEPDKKIEVSNHKSTLDLLIYLIYRIQPGDPNDINLARVMKIIEQNPTLINEKDWLGENALMHAIYNKDNLLIDFLIDKGIDLSSYLRSGNKNETVLIYALKTKNMALFDKIIERNTKNNQPININARDKQGYTALMYAVLNNDEDAVKILLKKFADPLITANDNVTSAATLAKKSGNPGIEELINAEILSDRGNIVISRDVVNYWLQKSLSKIISSQDQKDRPKFTLYNVDGIPSYIENQLILQGVRANMRKQKDKDDFSYFIIGTGISLTSTQRGHACAVIVDHIQKKTFFIDPYGEKAPDEINLILTRLFKYKVVSSITPQQKDRNSCDLYSGLNIIDSLEGYFQIDPKNGKIIRSGREINIDERLIEYLEVAKEFSIVEHQKAEENLKNRTAKSLLRDLVISNIKNEEEFKKLNPELQNNLKKFYEDLLWETGKTSKEVEEETKKEKKEKKNFQPNPEAENLQTKTELPTMVDDETRNRKLEDFLKQMTDNRLAIYLHLLTKNNLFKPEDIDQNNINTLIKNLNNASSNKSSEFLPDLISKEVDENRKKLIMELISSIKPVIMHNIDRDDPGYESEDEVIEKLTQVKKALADKAEINKFDDTQAAVYSFLEYDNEALKQKLVKLSLTLPEIFSTTLEICIDDLKKAKELENNNKEALRIIDDIVKSEESTKNKSELIAKQIYKIKAVVNENTAIEVIRRKNRELDFYSEELLHDNEYIKEISESGLLPKDAPIPSAAVLIAMENFVKALKSPTESDKAKNLAGDMIDYMVNEDRQDLIRHFIIHQKINFQTKTENLSIIDILHNIPSKHKKMVFLKEYIKIKLSEEGREINDDNINEKIINNIISVIQNNNYFDARLIEIALLIIGKDNINKFDGPFFLKSALEKNNIKAVQYLLEIGVKPDTKAENNDNDLIRLSFGTNHQMLELILNAAPPSIVKELINKPNKNNDYPLLNAIRKEEYNIARLLIENGADLNVRDKDDNNALMLLINSNKHDDILQFILSKMSASEKARAINEPNKNDEYPLLETVRKGQDKIARILIENNADLNVHNQKGSNVVLMASGNFEMLKLILNKMSAPEKIAAINKLNSSREYPLLNTISNFAYKNAQFLIENGADITVYNNSHDNVLTLLLDQSNENDEFINLILSKIEKLSPEEKALIINGPTKTSNPPLLIALEKGKYDVIKVLIQSGANLTICDKKLNNILMLAIQSDSKEILKLVLDEILKLPASKKEAIINQTNQYQKYPLFMAIEKGNFDLMKILFENGVNYNIQSDHSIVIAALDNSFEALQFILDAIPQSQRAKLINMPDHNDEYPLLAATGKSPDFISLLIQNGADFNIRDKNGNNAVILAVKNKNPQTLQIILDNLSPAEKKRAINEPNKYKEYPLLEAIKANNYDVAKILIQSGANLDLKNIVSEAMKSNAYEILKLVLDTIGESKESDVNKTNSDILSYALYQAIIKEKYDMVQLLVNNGVDLYSKQGFNNITNIDYAVRYARSSQILEFILGKLSPQERIKVCNPDKDAPLFLAIKAGRNNIAKVLIENGADLDARNEYGRNPFMDAIIYNNSEMLEFIIGKLPSAKIAELINTPDYPLLYAVKAKQYDIVRILFENGADLNVRDKDGNDALMLAAYSGSSKILKFILDKIPAGERAAAINQKISPKEYPLLNAIAEKQHDIVQILAREGANFSLQDKNGKNALILAIESNDDKMLPLVLDEIVKLPYKEKIQIINPRNSNYHPLLQAFRKEKYDVIKFLIENDADLSVAKGEALILAINSKNSQIIEFVLDKICQLPFEEKILIINRQDNFKDCPLSVALTKKKYDIIQLLVANGADLGICDSSGNNALMLAINSGNSQILKFVLDEIDKLPLEKRLSIINQRNSYNNYSLLNALERKKYDVAKFLIESGADLTVCDKKLNNSLMLAINDKNPQLAIDILNKLNPRQMKLVINQVNTNADTPLLMAVKLRQMEVANLLLKNGADLFQKNKEGHNVLHYISEYDESFRKSVTDKMSVDSKKVETENKTRNETTQKLMKAIDNSDISETEKLLKEDININYEKNGNILFHALKTIRKKDPKPDSIEIAKKVIHEIIKQEKEENKASGSIINRPFSIHNETPLILAVLKGQIEIVKLLIQNGANPFLVDKENNNVFTYTLLNHNNFTETVKTLIDEMLSNKYSREDISSLINTKTHGRFTSMASPSEYLLSYITQYPDKEKLFELFLEYGADPSFIDTQFSRSSLHKILIEHNEKTSKETEDLISAFDQGDIGKVKSLIHRFNHVSASKAYDILVYALHSNNEMGEVFLNHTREMAKSGNYHNVLLDLLNYQDTNGNTLLFEAISVQNENLIKFLITYGAGIFHHNANNSNIFTCAASTNNSQILKTLIEQINKSDILTSLINVKDQTQDCALAISIRLGNLEMSKLLLENGADPLILTKSDIDKCRNSQIKELIQTHIDLANDVKEIPVIKIEEQSSSSQKLIKKKESKINFDLPTEEERARDEAERKKKQKENKLNLESKKDLESLLENFEDFKQKDLEELIKQQQTILNSLPSTNPNIQQQQPLHQTRKRDDKKVEPKGRE